jgi:dTDP-4-amino-4,6-dideoxygalactose transaminase
MMREFPRLRPPRLIANLWGTTTPGDCAAILRLIAQRRKLVDGPELPEYERAFAARVGVKHAVSFASGRVALYAVLRAHGVGAGDEVILQVPTHVVVANAVRYTGAAPVFVDCARENYNMDLAAAAAAVTPRSRVLLIQHTFGIPMDMGAAAAFAGRHGLLLIEDCVHALGARFEGRAVGSFGASAFFSTEETKTISSTMGGMAVTGDDRIQEALVRFQKSCAVASPALVRRYLVKQMAYHLLSHPLVHHLTRPLYLRLRRFESIHLAPGATGRDEAAGGRPPSYEARLANGQAIVAMRQLARLDGNLAHRKQIADRYMALLAGSSCPTPLLPAGAEPAYVRFPVAVADRDRVMKALAPQAVLGRWFDQVLEEASDPAAVGYRAGSCPNAEFLARHLVNLPTHMRVRPKDTAALVAALVAASASAEGPIPGKSMRDA